MKHDNRDIEYIDLKRALKAKFADGQMDHKSCEMMAKDICLFVAKRHGKREIKVQVLEDGENGALYEPTPDEAQRLVHMEQQGTLFTIEEEF